VLLAGSGKVNAASSKANSTVYAYGMLLNSTSCNGLPRNSLSLLVDEPATVFRSSAKDVLDATQRKTSAYASCIISKNGTYVCETEYSGVSWAGPLDPPFTVTNR
jgi:hypothetical protein